MYTSLVAGRRECNVGRQQYEQSIVVGMKPKHVGVSK